MFANFYKNTSRGSKFIPNLRKSRKFLTFKYNQGLCTTETSAQPLWYHGGIHKVSCHSNPWTSCVKNLSHQHSFDVSLNNYLNAALSGSPISKTNISALQNQIRGFSQLFVHKNTLLLCISSEKHNSSLKMPHVST